ncbi:MAG: hypothetical protein E7560_02175 [Ruminococcaceae bacterium]|nr:hypothetical protein [Oscillospiraceae bacterium]
MFQNIKTDIIYYKTATDFEMEFNLCGCCRMRLLTDKSPDKKTLIQSLARAVSRSRVIIVTGNLFGEEGITSLVATAIGNKLAVADNKTFGIIGDDEIEIIAGSTPLVTKEGIFGGCIIESGPQTLILLSDSKNVRKQIMQTLIHPYIEELYTADLTEKAAQNAKSEVAEESLEESDLIFEEASLQDASEQTDDAELVIPETEEAEKIPEEAILEESNELVTESEEIKETDPKTEEIIAEQAELIFEDDEFSAQEPTVSFQEDEDIVLTNGMSFETEDKVIASNVVEDEEIEMFGGVSKAERRKERRAYKGYHVESFDEDEDFIYDDFRKTNSFGGSSLNLPILIVSIILLVLLAVLAYCIFYIPANNGVSAQEYLKEIFETLFRG